MSSTGVTRAARSLTIASGVTLPGVTPRTSCEQLRPPERESGGTKQLGEPVEVDLLLVEAGDQPKPILLVLEEQVLAMCARNVARVRLRLLDREHGRMERSPVLDAQGVEPGQDLVSSCQHGRDIAAPASAGKPRRHALVMPALL